MIWSACAPTIYNFHTVVECQPSSQGQHDKFVWTIFCLYFDLFKSVFRNLRYKDARQNCKFYENKIVYFINNSLTRHIGIKINNIKQRTLKINSSPNIRNLWNWLFHPHFLKKVLEVFTKYVSLDNYGDQKTFLISFFVICEYLWG